MTYDTWESTEDESRESVESLAMTGDQIEVPEVGDDDRREIFIRGSSQHFGMHPINVLYNDRNLIELFMMIYAIYVGIQLFIDPPILRHPIPNEWRIGWRILLITSAMWVIVGLFWVGRAVTAYALEQIGYIGLGFGALAYGTATLDPVYAVFGLFALGRVVQIDLYIKSVNSKWYSLFKVFGRRRRRLGEDQP